MFFSFETKEFVIRYLLKLAKQVYIAEKIYAITEKEYRRKAYVFSRFIYCKKGLAVLFII